MKASSPIIHYFCVGIGGLVSREGMVECIMRSQGCDAPVFDDQFIALKVSSETFRKLMLARKKVMEYQVRREVRCVKLLHLNTQLLRIGNIL